MFSLIQHKFYLLGITKIINDGHFDAGFSSVFLNCEVEFVCLRASYASCFLLYRNVKEFMNPSNLD